MGVRCIICVPVRRYVSLGGRSPRASFFFPSVFSPGARRKHERSRPTSKPPNVTVRLTEFFGFLQLIARCKRERECGEIYAPRRFAGGGGGCCARSQPQVHLTKQLRNVSGRAEMRTDAKRAPVTSSYLIYHVCCDAGPEFRKLRGPLAAS